jgi:hypothetical protein
MEKSQLKNLVRVKKEEDLMTIFQERKNTLIVVMFSMPDCPACVVLKQALKKSFAPQFPNYFFVYIDTADYKQKSRFVEDLEGFPTFLICYNGTVSQQFATGDPNELRSAIMSTVYVLENQQKEAPKKLVEKEQVPRRTMGQKPNVQRTERPKIANPANDEEEETSKKSKKKTKSKEEQLECDEATGICKLLKKSKKTDIPTEVPRSKGKKQKEEVQEDDVVPEEKPKKVKKSRMVVVENDDSSSEESETEEPKLDSDDDERSPTNAMQRETQKKMMAMQQYNMRAMHMGQRGFSMMPNGGYNPMMMNNQPRVNPMMQFPTQPMSADQQAYMAWQQKQMAMQQAIMNQQRNAQYQATRMQNMQGMMSQQEQMQRYNAMMQQMQRQQ